MTAEARQAEGFPEVLLKDTPAPGGTNIAKVPNGERLTILADHGAYIRVRWGAVAGFAKASNLVRHWEDAMSQVQAAHELPVTALARQADGYPEVVLKTACDSTGSVVAMVANGQLLTIIAEHGDYVQVHYQGVFAFAKSSNLLRRPDLTPVANLSAAGYRLPEKTDIMCFGRPLHGAPSASPETDRRWRVLMETLVALGTSERRAWYHAVAQKNLCTWRDNSALDASATDKETVFPVLCGDWGEVTLMLTQRYGTQFAVLNMANAYVAGGGYMEGMPAQEENMFRRTDCHFGVDCMEFDQAADRYKPEVSDLINAAHGKVFLNVERSHVCIRGPEMRGQSDLGYQWLPSDCIFPFYELRSAAVDLRDGSRFCEGECRKRIEAQIETLKARGVRHAVLSAFGCGAFLNPPQVVAKCYCDALKAHGKHFDCVAFAIYYPGYGHDNFKVFQQVFQQEGLG